MKKLQISALLMTGVLALSQGVFAANAVDDVKKGTSDAVNGTVDATKDVGRATGKAIESTGKATKDVFQ
jgi:hypothetical protein